MAHVGAALKTHLVNSVKNTWNTVYQLAMFSKVPSGRSIEYDPRVVSIFIIQFCINFGFIRNIKLYYSNIALIVSYNQTFLVQYSINL